MQLLTRFGVAVGAFWCIDSILYDGIHFGAARTVLGYIVAGMIQMLP